MSTTHEDVNTLASITATDSDGWQATAQLLDAAPDHQTGAQTWYLSVRKPDGDATCAITHQGNRYSVSMQLWQQIALERGRYEAIKAGLAMVKGAEG